MFDVFYAGVKPNLFAHEQAVDSVEQAQELSRTRFFWFVNYLSDYSGFDFLWEPKSWEAHQRHAWPSQWQKDSGTYLVPKQGYSETNYRGDYSIKRLPDMSNWFVPDTFDESSFDFSWHPDPTEPGYIYQFGTQHQRTGGPQYIVNGASDLKFCDQIKGNVKSGVTPIVEINHMDGNAGLVPGVISTVRYFDNYKDTLARIANSAEHEYIWIISSVCNYTNFDFSWHPEVWQNTMLHVFASDGNKFGDTFYMHVPSFKNRIKQFDLLDWYDLNFINNSVPRRPLPIVRHTSDSQAEPVKNESWVGPLAVFAAHNQAIESVPCVPLWREKTKTIVPLDTSGSTVVVPRAAIPYIKTQLYDYPYIDKTKRNTYNCQPMNIVFISYDEPQAEENWSKLKARFPEAKRVHGVEGMELALLKAAEISDTPWYYAVFAKTELASEFDFSFQPDYFQEPKHYIFHSHNVMNGLEYGHMGVVLYNCNIVKNIKEFGIDYTLSAKHEVVPIVSAIASFNSNPYQTWRTAFREAAKLAQYIDEERSVETSYRLDTWTNRAEGKHAEWCLRGARDGKEFYEQHRGDDVALKQAFDWRWLKTKFASHYDDVDNPNEDKLKLRQLAWQQ